MIHRFFKIILAQWVKIVSNHHSYLNKNCFVLNKDTLTQNILIIDNNRFDTIQHSILKVQDGMDSIVYLSDKQILNKTLLMLSIIKNHNIKIDPVDFNFLLDILRQTSKLLNDRL
jgi:hypothetical protein